MLRTKILLDSKNIRGTVSVLLAGILAGSMFVSPLSAQSTAAAPKPTKVTAKSRYKPDPFAGRAGTYYSLIWGVEALSVKAVEQGELIRFSYRIVDPKKATVFNNKKFDAFLDSPEHNARLIIPTLEKVGQMRQYNDPVQGTSYWMAFSNPRRTVKRGDRVNVVIGQFHADGLIVQ